MTHCLIVSPSVSSQTSCVCSNFKLGAIFCASYKKLARDRRTNRRNAVIQWMQRPHHHCQTIAGLGSESIIYTAPHVANESWERLETIVERIQADCEYRCVVGVLALLQLLSAQCPPGDTRRTVEHSHMQACENRTYYSPSSLLGILSISLFEYWSDIESTVAISCRVVQNKQKSG